MRLYHRTNFLFLQSSVLILLSIVLWGCSQPQAIQRLISISIRADHKDIQLKITAGSTVQQALNLKQIILGELDQVEPSLSTVLADGDQVKVTRVREELYIEQVIIPFEHQEQRNEALPEGEIRLSQPGVNGLNEITYQRLFKDGVEISNSVVKTTVIKEAKPEIEMIGSRSMFAAIPIPRKLAYLSAGNAWVIENHTGDRELIVSTADLDGRVFSLSRDGKYLLFTRFSTVESAVNTLWMASLESNEVEVIDLKVGNIVHFAEIDPTSTSVAFSTVEWREAAPGWQANNDLYEMELGSSGYIGSPRQVLESSSGGVYGWWGTEFSWSPDGSQILYARPDSIGIIDPEAHTQTSILNISPYQTGGNWAWVPGAAWSPDGNIVYSVNQTISGTVSAGEALHFDLFAIPLLGGSPIDLVRNVGMFAYPVVSPAVPDSTLADPLSGERVEQVDFRLAYLQALLPDQSETSTYRLFTIDQDGSNKRALFPEEGAPGLEPQYVAWSPTRLGTDGNYAIALVYNGNIWIIDAGTGIAQQITGDGLTTRVDWR